MSANTTASPDADRFAATTGDPWISDGKKPSVSRLRAATRGRSLPHLLLGMLLVLACAGGFVLTSSTFDGRRAVLALARDVSVGQVLTAQDLRQVDVAVDAGVAMVGAHEASTVVGRPMATSLSTGSLLTPNSIGAAAVPPRGQAIAALALKPGQFPPEVAAGARVSLVFAPGTTGAAVSPPSDGGSAWPAVVAGVTNPPNEQTTVVSVQLTEAAARQVAAVAAGQLSVVLLPAGGR